MEEILYYGLDSNIILLDANNIHKYDKVVIPLTVIKEIDSKKTLSGELGYQAREFGRLITKATKLNVVNHTGISMVVFKLNNTIIHIISTNEDNSLSNDEKIINSLVKYRDTYGKTVFVSNDVNARTIADITGMDTQPLIVVEDKVIPFHKEVTLDNDTFHILHGLPAAELPFHENGTYNYTINHENNGHIKIAKVTNGKLDVMDSIAEKYCREQLVTPTNKKQLMMSQAILDTDIAIVVVEAPAGAGKTILAISSAMKLVAKGKADGIVYIRNSVNDVESNEEVGFLSGNEEKFNIYLNPYYDTIDYIVREQLKKKKLKAKELEEAVSAATEELVKNYNMEATITLGMRGRTFHNKVVILDEFQNTTSAAAQKILTRMGKGTKVIVLGSNRQIDNAFVTKHDNGMSLLMKGATLAPEGINVHVIQLDKIVRSPIAEFAEKLYSGELKN